jgi:branched-chain amino acid transport system substrate-binding protein
VLGQEVQLSSGDEAGDAGVASEEADRLLAEGVHAIVGAAASGMSLAIIDQITGAGIPQCSASNTAPDFTDYDDNGFYFRTAPSDGLQGPALAEIILEDGHTDVALLARADDYGVGLMNATADALEEAGATVVYQESYDPEQVTFSAEVSEMIGAGPDAIVTIPFDEGVQILQELIEQGWDTAATYGADGIRSAGLNEDVDPDDPNVIDGFKGTNPEPDAAPGFLDRLQEFDPDLDEFTFAPHAYDCANWVMLAAEAAGSVDSTAIRDSMFDVIDGDNECNNFPDCAEFLRDGQTVAYQFATGTTDWADVGEPAAGQFEIWEWQDAELVSIDTVEFILE